MTDSMTTDADSTPAPSSSRGSASSVGAPVVLALLVVYVVWGSTYLAIRYVVATMPPFLSAAVRFTVAGLVLYPWAIRRGGAEQRRSDKPTRRHWLSALIIGGMLLAFGNGTVSVAERSVPSGTAALLVGMVPLWMALFGRLQYKERLTPVAVIGLLVGFGGVALLVGGGSGQLKASGVALLVGATLAWALGSLYARGAPMPARPLVGTAMEMIAGGAVCVVMGAATGEFSRIHLDKFRASSWIGLAYLIVFGSLFAYSAYTWLLRNAPTPLVSTYAYVNPAVAVFLGWLIASEQLTARTAVAAAVIVVGVALIVSGPWVHRRRAS
jgi:drug/metabolite transporter (DMT)-like permease